jgi:hypothetical protein
LATSTDPGLIEVTEILLVPSSFLVAALGTADTNLHRAAVSLLGLIVNILWWAGAREALGGHVAWTAEPGRTARPWRTRILLWLPVVFVAGWLGSLVVHAWRWNRPLGG